jgi:predicted metal-binding membrane protein
MFRAAVPSVIERAALVSSVLLLALAAWLSIWAFDDFAHSLLHLHGMDHHAWTSGSLALFFIGGWTVMTVAMMLPTTLPIIATFHTIAGSREDRVLLIALVIIGYLAIWASFGVVVYIGHLFLQLTVDSIPPFKKNIWVAVPSMLLIAGVFQFTSLKYRCLDKCRSPFSFVIEHWQGRNERWNAFRLGVDNGIFCVGCCWALMLLMFVVGFGSIGWMFLLAVIMAIEKNVTWGRRISAPLGVILIGIGLLLLFIPRTL